MNFVRSHFKEIKSGVLIILGIFLIVFYVQSNDYFRLRLVNYYKNRQQYTKAIQIYNKILRKGRVKKSLPKEICAKIYFELGYLYAQLNFTNAAIESYARGVNNDTAAKVDSYYFRDLDKDKLLAIGFLEAGIWEKAIYEFKRLESQYRYLPYEDAQRFINIAKELKNKNLDLNDKNSLFLIGDAYIQNNLFNEARSFFSKRILDYGIEPLEVLGYLQKNYSEDKDILQKVWGGNIYVTLEDFESIDTQLINWVSKVAPKVNSHYIDNEIAYKGHYSEWLDATYFKERKIGDFDFWVKNVKISLMKSNLKLGIRLFLRKIKPNSPLLGINIVYPQAEASGIFCSSDKLDIGSDWEEYKIKNLFESANINALRRSWNAEGAILDKIVIDTKCIPTKIFIDEIELFLE